MFRWEVLICLLLGVFLLFAGSLPVSLAESPLTVMLTPEPGSEHVEVTQSLTVLFNKMVYLPNGEELQKKNAHAIFRLRRKDTGEVVATDISWSKKYRKLLIKPIKSLEYGTTYALSVPAGAVKDYRGQFNREAETEFTTISLGPPFSVQFTPAHQSVEVSPKGPFVITLNKYMRLADKEEITNATVGNLVKLTDQQGNSVPISAVWNLETRQITVDPIGNLKGGDTFTLVLMEKKLLDEKGEKNSRFFSTFTTMRPVDVIPPTANLTPGHGAKEVKLSDPITVEFAEPVRRRNGTEITREAIGEMLQVYDDENRPIPVHGVWSKEKRRLTVTVKGGKWNPYTMYTVVISADAVVDGEGNRNLRMESVFSTGGK